VDEFEQIADQLRTLAINLLWGVFFLVPTGRGEALHVLDPDAAEVVLERLVTIAREAPFAYQPRAGASAA
jgi:MoaA/NifB/PqqE/SkfB family radical SAM enzyme